MKLSTESLSKYTFWLSFLGGIPQLFGLTPTIQSVNICVIPALILLLKSQKVISRDSLILLLILIFYTLVCLFSKGFSGYKTTFEFYSVILTYIALRSSRYFPSQKGITIYLIASLGIGLFQLFQGGIGATRGIGLTRGIPLLASEPSRYARYMAVLILPIFIHWNSLKAKLSQAFLFFTISFLIFYNRSASLIIPFLVLAFTLMPISIDYLKKFLNTLKINKYILILFSSATIFLTLSVSYLSSSNIRIIRFISYFFKTIFVSGDYIRFLQIFGGSRFATVLYSFQSGIKSFIPNGVDSAKNFLNYENLTNTAIGLNPYQMERLKLFGSFESASFFSHLTLDAGLIAFILSILFTYIILKQLKDSYLSLIFEKDTSINIKIESALRISTSFVGLILLWFYSSNSFMQPWLMVFIGLQQTHKTNKNIPIGQN